MNEYDIERYYLSQELNTDFSDHKNLKVLDIQTDVNTDIPYSQQDFEHLVSSFLRILDAEKENKDLCSFIKKITLLGKLLSDLYMMKMIPCDFENFCLTENFNSYLTKIYNQILSIDPSKINLKILLDILKSLNVLYRTRYNLKINNIIISSTSFNVLKKIITFAKIEVDDEDNDLDKDLAYQCKIYALNALALYCCLGNGSEISELQIKIVKSLLKSEKYSLKEESDMKLVFMILNSLSNMPYEMLNNTFLVSIDEFLVIVFIEWHMDYKVSQCLLLLLPKFLRQAVHINYDTANLLNICHNFYILFKDKKQFGQIVQLSMVKCLNEIIKEKELCRNEKVILNSEVILYFINNIYFSVREESLAYVNDIYSKDNLSFDWKFDFMTRLKNIANEMFVIDKPDDHQIILDELKIRSVNVVKLFTNIVKSQSFFESMALSTLIEISVKKSKFKFKIFNLSFNLIVDELVTKYFS